LWEAETNALDSAGTNHGVAVSTGYTAGMIGQAFNFNGGRVEIPDNSSFCLTNALSIMGWVHPTGPGYAILWRGDDRPGMDPYVLSMQGNNNIAFMICDANGHSA